MDSNCVSLWVDPLTSYTEFELGARSVRGVRDVYCLLFSSHLVVDTGLKKLGDTLQIWGTLQRVAGDLWRSRDFNQGLATIPDGRQRCNKGTCAIVKQILVRSPA